MYFLIFAQFALLTLAARTGVSAMQLKPLLVGMGAGGIAGAMGATWVFRPEAARRLLALCFAGCATAAVAAAFVTVASSWSIIFATVGLSLGALTVTLAAMLRRAVGGVRLGLCVGAGTGAAYALCNLPLVFGAEPRTQTLLAAVAAALGGLLAQGFATGTAGEADAPTRGAVARWVVALAALVWMDSAAFFIIQQNQALRAQTWVGDATLLANAGVHLTAGVLSGVLLDAGWKRAPALTAIGLLGAACLMLNETLPVLAPGWLYVAGVSFYSVVLVYFPASTERAGVAAVVYAIAGWMGSALGIGMAQDLQSVPVWFVAVAVAAVALALGWRGRGAAAMVAVALLGGGTRAEAADEFVARGREVYIHEGCIHCHSQYVRPHVALDVERWGPATTLERVLAGAPPLPGNRRQGPDLANVGNRRSGEWNRLHLKMPRAVAPGSRMPVYAHLFEHGGDESDGEALIAYLASLGADSISERLTQVRGWRPARAMAVSDTRARQLFGRLCAHCHGASGRGDGALASALSVRPPDWTTGPWRHVLADADVELELSRIIKFGLTGSPMAGHEYLRDEEIVGLARLVRAWQKR
ncbi:MAG: hypothetical protein C0518_11180 [Opitutus sp.]|nr:hypothetical protein [Opitutus sp.]